MRTSRIVKLLPQVVKMLNEIPRVNHRRKVFLSALEKPLPYWTTYCHDTWKNALATAGITDACLHDLRHDFITNAIPKGTRPYILMKQVGNKSDAMLRRYQLIDEDDLEMLEM
jgi:integrase